MYVAVKGGESAILASYDLLAQQRRGDPAVAELSVAQIQQQLRLAAQQQALAVRPAGQLRRAICRQPTESRQQSQGAGSTCADPT